MSRWHDSLICDMTQSYGPRHNCITRTLIHSYVSVTWLIHMWHDSFICDMTHSHVTWLIHIWHDSFPRAKITMIWRTHRLIHTSHWHDSFVRNMTHPRETRLNPTRQARNYLTHTPTHSCMILLIRTWHNSFTCEMTQSETWASISFKSYVYNPMGSTCLVL